MNTKKMIAEFANHLNTLESLKALANKYDNTELELSSDEWESIKANRINKRDWLRHGQTSVEWYNEMINTTQNILNKIKKN